MRDPSYCFKSLESIYYFRMRVPTDLRPILNRTELKKSLRTKSESVALCRCRHYVAAAENVFETLRINNFRAELASETILYTSTVAPDHSPPAQVTNQRKENEKELWNAIFNGNKEIAETPPGPPVSPEPVNLILLSELIQLYTNEITSQRGPVISSGIEKNLLRFLEIVADKPIDQYVIEDRQRYRDILLRIPKGVNRPKYSDLSIEDIIK